MIINVSVPCFDMENVGTGDIWEIVDSNGTSLVTLDSVSADQVTGKKQKVENGNLVISDFTTLAIDVISGTLIKKYSHTYY